MNTARKSCLWLRLYGCSQCCTVMSKCRDALGCFCNYKSVAVSSAASDYINKRPVESWQNRYHIYHRVFFFMKLEYGLIITWRVIIPVSLTVIMTVNVSSKCAAVWNHDKFSVTCSVKVRLSSVTTATVTSQVGRKPSAVWRRHQVFIIPGKMCDTDVFIGRICPEHKLCSSDWFPTETNWISLLGVLHEVRNKLLMRWDCLSVRLPVIQ
jgi:hypothetical protein